MGNQRVDWLAGGDRRSVARDRIGAAATELILAHGIDGLSVDDVAARAGCSRATLYRHVGGKTALVRMVVMGAAEAVAARVAAEVEGHRGSRRAVEAILASVTAIRTDLMLSQWVTGAGSSNAEEFLAAAPDLGRIAVSLTRITPDHEAAQWIVRVVLSLLAWPLPDAAMERRMVQRFVAPLFAHERPGA